MKNLKTNAVTSAKSVKPARMKEFASHFAVVAVLALLGFGALSCRKDEPKPESYNLTVFVTDEASVPVQYAQVTVGKREDRTDAEGKCSFAGLQERGVVVKVSADNYQPVSQTVTFSEQSQSVTVRLTQKPPYLSVDQEQIVTRETNSKTTVHIESNVDWRIESSSPALSFSPREGNGRQDVTVSWSFPLEQEDEDVALAEFSVVSSVDPVTVPVRCLLPIRVVKTEGISANLMKDREACSVARVTFSRRIVPEEVWSVGSERLEFRAVDEHTVEVEIPTAWSFLGATYQIDRLKVRSANEDGVSFDGRVFVEFFDAKASIEGDMRFWSFTQDESRIWASMEFPSRIYELDARSFEVLKSFELDWLPGQCFLNPYNGRLYVVDQTNQVLRVLDPASGKTVKTITLEPDEFDHPQSPNTIPYNISFADNGVGVLIATSIDDTFRWFFIDSRQDDLVERNPVEKEFGLDHEYVFSRMYLDRTRTKLVGAPLTHLSQRAIIVDCVNKSAVHFEVDKDFGAPSMDSAGGVILQARPHKEKDLMFFCAPFSTVVYDYVSGTYSLPFIDAFGGSVCDFCYGPLFGGDVCTYCISEGGVTIFNHSKNIVQFGTYLLVDHARFVDFFSFKEGDRIVLFGYGEGCTTTFVTLDTSRFFQ